MKRFLSLLLLFLPCTPILHAAETPNIVYIMSDELAYYEVGFMGSEHIQTPRIDAMAARGIHFTQALAGAPVCAPLRCNLMTGKHAGHASVRANDGGTPLRAGEPTIASMLKQRGYATGGYGKWGCGGRGSTGVPEQHGFDDFFGYYDQVHAHSFYPAYLVRNSEEVSLPGNAGGRSGDTYSHYEIMKAGLNFIRENKDGPFFAYFPITPPHGMYDIPDSDPAWALYKDKAWPEDAKRYAAMVSMVDRDVGDILDLLAELKLQEHTIVFFAGDNGGADRFRSKEKPRGFFGPNVHPKTGVGFRGGKGNLYEGGLRIPSVAYWPGMIPAGAKSDLIWYQPDVLPTLAELAGATPPADVDGISILPTLTGKGKQTEREFLYWEYSNMRAVRMGLWKAVSVKGTWSLYDLETDVSERTDVAAAHPDILARMTAFAASAHEPVSPGTYEDAARALHRKDQQAKWGGRQAPGKGGLGKPAAWDKKGLVRSEAFKLLAVSSEAKAPGRSATAAFDGDPQTWWHSNFAGKVEEHPHEITLDLGDAYPIKGIRYLARQDGGWNGAVRKCEIQIFTDPKAAPIASIPHSFAKIKTTQQLDFKTVTGRYVKLRVLSEVNGGPWASVAELGLVWDRSKKK